jgi:hypothetical protein
MQQAQAPTRTNPTPREAPTSARSEANQLPKGWQQCISKTSGRTYYYNRSTGESTFIMPKPTDEIAEENALPPGWAEMTSKTTGKIYYWNAALQKSQFERPTS